MTVNTIITTGEQEQKKRNITFPPLAGGTAKTFPPLAGGIKGGGRGYTRTKLITPILCLILLLTTAGCGILKRARKPATPAKEGYVIQPRDVISISVWRHEDLTQAVEVNNEGMISFPLLKEVKAAGLTAEELEDVLTTALAKDYLKDPHVTVHVRKKPVYVTGQVKRPGPVELQGPLTVSEAIVLAGGFTDFAARGKVRIIRSEASSKKIIRVNVKRVMAGKREKDVQLQPGDVIEVPQSFF